MDLSKISTKNLKYLNKNQLDTVSTAGLEEYQRQVNVAQPTPQVEEANVVLEKRPVTPMGERFAQGFADPFLGGGQRAIEVGKAPQAFVTNPLINLMNVLGQKSLDLGLKATGQKPAAEQIQQDVAQTRQNYVAPEGIDFARMGGNILNPTTFMAPANVAQSLLGKAATGAGVGAGYGALVPTMSPDELTNNISMTAGFGAGIPIIGSALGRVISPKASTNAELKTIQEMGISPTLGQMLGGKANLFEEKVTQIPFIGNVISSARDQNERKFREGIFNKILSNIDEKLPSQKLVGRDLVSYTSQKLQSSYNNILDKIGAVPVDKTFANQADELSNMIQKSGVSPEKISEFNFLLKPIRDAQSELGYITSNSFKEIQSNLSSQARTLKASQNIFDKKLGKAADQLGDNLQGMLERHAVNIGNVDGKNLAKELSKTDKAYAMYKRVEKASGAIGAASGEFTPAQLSNAVRALEKQPSKYARGEALLQNISDAGKNVLGNKISNANPWIKGLITGAGGGTAYAAGVAVPTILGTIAATVGTYGLYNPISRKLINKAVTERPDIAPAVREFINQQSNKATAGIPSLLSSEGQQ